MSRRKDKSFPIHVRSGIWIGVLLIASNVYGLVLHPDGEPPIDWSAKPPDSVVGRWRTNASCVAIAPNYIITVRHAGGTVGAGVYFAGVEYRVAEQFIEPTTADLRICRIKKVPPPEDPTADIPANLQHYATPYTLTNEDTTDIDVVVVGGYGDSRGATLYTSNNKPYAYDWDASAGNTVQRWGTNRIDQIFGPVQVGDPAIYITETLLADFDDLNVSGTAGATTYETIAADHDSGGGWFIYCTNSWKLLGLSVYLVDEQAIDLNHDCQDSDPELCTESWFRDNSVANGQNPDRMFVLRISSYAAWINSIVPAPNCVSLVAGDFSGDCITDETDLNLMIRQWARTDCSSSNNHCLGADFQPDGNVDIFEFAFLSGGWLTSSDVILPCN